MMASEEQRFPSVGMGEDCRYTAHGLLGSALQVDEWLVHLAFFRSAGQRYNGNSPEEHMASLSRRRASRTL